MLCVIYFAQNATVIKCLVYFHFAQCFSFMLWQFCLFFSFCFSISFYSQIYLCSNACAFYYVRSVTDWHHKTELWFTPNLLYEQVKWFAPRLSAQAASFSHQHPSCSVLLLSHLHSNWSVKHFTPNLCCW